MNKISVVDYGAGNIGSVLNMLQHIGVAAEVITGPDQVKKSEKIILPGVGNWDAGVQRLEDSGLIDALKNRVLSDKVPILGVCLGMQLFLNSSEEGMLPGLGWIDGTVKTFNFSRINVIAKRLPLPHMGWNSVTVMHNSILTESLDENSKFYFVHSFHVDVKYSENVMLQTDYGYPFTSGIRKENIYGVQFHPEKSHRHGMNLMKSFASI
jgi:glutamine amidotransferase